MLRFKCQSGISLQKYFFIFYFGFNVFINSGHEILLLAVMLVQLSHKQSFAPDAAASTICGIGCLI